jgi:SAM-dependent methyltransferase
MASSASHLYADKFDGYFDCVRKEILPLIPKALDRVLELGCGTGHTLQYLKANGFCSWVAGVELFPEAAQQARTRVDCLFEGNVEQMEIPIEPSSLDAILCLDVLEHLSDPAEVVRRLHRLLAPGGFILASIPNVCHYTASLPLVVLGDWKYKPCGILDKTHLRFFVRNTAAALMTSSGLEVDAFDCTYLYPRDRILNNMSARVFRRFFEYQFLIRVRNR